MVKLFQNGYPQQVIAHRLKKSQSYVSKHLARLLERLDREELDDGSRTYSDIDFEILWKKFALTHKTDDFGDVILETFHYLLGAQAWEEFLIWFFSFTEYYRFALKVLFTLDDCPWPPATPCPPAHNKTSPSRSDTAAPAPSPSCCASASASVSAEDSPSA